MQTPKNESVQMNVRDSEGKQKNIEKKRGRDTKTVEEKGH